MESCKKENMSNRLANHSVDTVVVCRDLKSHMTTTLSLASSRFSFSLCCIVSLLVPHIFRVCFSENALGCLDSFRTCFFLTLLLLSAALKKNQFSMTIQAEG